MSQSSQPRQPRNRLLGWTRRIGLGLLVTLVVLAVIGASYQTVATAIDAPAFPPPGQLVNVDGHMMHIVCAGPQNNASPTVILDHVGATNAAQWGLVQPEIAKTTRVCAYDRAGFGWSEPGPAPRDALQSTYELHALLRNADVPGPYILVGHSYGANVARLYVAEFPDEVAGMVLVDPGIVFHIPGVPTHVNEQWMTADQTVMRVVPYLSRLGIVRLAAALGALPGHGDLPEPSAAAFDALNLTTKFWDAVAAQNVGMAATSQEVLSASQDFGARPLIVLSATVPDDEARREWMKVNAALAARSSNSVHRIVENATHMSLALNHEQAQVTIAAILQVVDAASKGKPLE